MNKHQPFNAILRPQQTLGRSMLDNVIAQAAQHGRIIPATPAPSGFDNIPEVAALWNANWADTAMADIRRRDPGFSDPRSHKFMVREIIKHDRGKSSPLAHALFKEFMLNAADPHSLLCINSAADLVIIKPIIDGFFFSSVASVPCTAPLVNLNIMLAATDRHNLANSENMPGHQRDGQGNRQREAYKKARNQSPHHPAVVAEGILMAIDTPSFQPNVALEKIETGLGRHPDHPHLLTAKGQVLVKLGDVDAAQALHDHWTAFAHPDDDRPQYLQTCIAELQQERQAAAFEQKRVAENARSVRAVKIAYELQDISKLINGAKKLQGYRALMAEYEHEPVIALHFAQTSRLGNQPRQEKAYDLLEAHNYIMDCDPEQQAFSYTGKDDIRIAGIVRYCLHTDQPLLAQKYLVLGQGLFPQQNYFNELEAMLDKATQLPPARGRRMWMPYTRKLPKHHPLHGEPQSARPITAVGFLQRPVNG